MTTKVMLTGGPMEPVPYSLEALASPDGQRLLGWAVITIKVPNGLHFTFDDHIEVVVVPSPPKMNPA